MLTVEKEGKQAKKGSSPRPTVKTEFHLDLSNGIPGEEYWVVALGKKHPIVAHTAQSRAAAKAKSPKLAALADTQLTHYTPTAVDMPADRVCRVHVNRTMNTTPGAQGQTGAGLVAIHIPPTPPPPAGSPAPNNVQVITELQSAQALLFHHPDFVNADTEVATVVFNHMTKDTTVSSKINAIASKMKQLGPPNVSSGWAHLDPYTPPATTSPAGNVWFDGNTTINIVHPTDELKAAAGPAMVALMKAVKNDPVLKDKKWTLTEGTSVQANTAAQLAKLAARFTATAGDDWQPVLQHEDDVCGFGCAITVLDATKKQLKLDMTNKYMRYLGAYIRFYDSDGNAMNVPGWSADDAGIVVGLVDELDIQYDDMRFLGYLNPVDDVMAIPITADPGECTATITFPDGAVSASVYGSGIGTGADLWPKSPLIGGLLTGLCNFAIPTFMLAAGAAIQSSKPLYDAVEGITSNKAFRAVMGAALTAYFGYEIGKPAAQEHKFNWGALVDLFKMMFQKGAEGLLAYVEGTMAAEEAAEEVPFAGWIILAVDIFVGAAEMAQTIVEVASSPWNIENQISLSITTGVTIHPDPRHGAFPQSQPTDKVHYVVKMTYQDQNRPVRSDPHDITGGGTDATLSASFPANTLGGNVKFEADYYINDWLAAKATTGWMKNDDETVANVDVYLVQFPVPLTDKSIYTHSAILTYQNGAYAWQQTPNAPTGTIANTDTTPTGNGISVWSGLTLSQRYGMIGVGYKAAGLGVTECGSTGGPTAQYFAFQNVNIPGQAINALKVSSCGLDGQSMLVYDPYPPKFQQDTNGQWLIGADGKPVADPNDTQVGNYWVDPRKASNDQTADGGYHLRKVTLDATTPIDMGTTGTTLLSSGRFPFAPDSIALHPSGHVVAVNQENKKIMIGLLEPDGKSDDGLPLAKAYSGEAQQPDRPGLLFHPVGVTCSYDGTILVLEDTKSSTGATTTVIARVQAFDLLGNPVNRFFDANGQPSSFLMLSTTGDNTYLDIVAVGDQKMTYIYILYYTGDGSAVADYHMAIYQYGDTAPASNPLVTTDGIAAARLAVDMWHSAYTLNYQMVTDGQGNPAGPTSPSTGPKGRTVPSVSEWLPPTP